MRPAPLGLVLISFVFALPAVAEPVGYSDGEEWGRPRVTDPDQQLEPEAAVGFLAGTSSVGSVAGSTFGFHVDAGARFRRLALLGEYDFLYLSESTSEHQPIRGLVHRLGVTFRYSFGVLSTHDLPLRGDFWIEGGVGRELIRWYDGGKLSRNDISFGLAGQVAIRWGAHKHKKLGVYYAAKFLIANRPDQKMLPPGCAGPCDERTGIIPYDLGIFFNLGVPFGR